VTLNVPQSLIVCLQQLELNHIIASYYHDMLTLNVPQSLTACLQQLELNHIIESYYHDDKENNYELRIKVREI
jgi:hypothetical protein